MLSLPPGKRIDSIPCRLDRVRAGLRTPLLLGSAQARVPDEQIEEFGREVAASGLQSLGGAPA